MNFIEDVNDCVVDVLTEAIRVLVVDDDVSICDMTKDALSDFGFSCDVESDGHKAMHRLKQSPLWDVVLVDGNMPGFDTNQLIDLAKEQGLKVIQLSGMMKKHPRSDAAMEKPWSPRALRDLIHKTV